MHDLPTFADIESAARQIAGVAHRTPVATSRTIDARTGAELFFKCENLQRAGAFKFRGAYNALSRLDADERRRGVVTFSSGNHAQAIALAGQVLDIPRVIVMPSDAPAVKRIATEGYGGEVVLYDRDTRGPRSDRPAARRRARPDADSALRSPAHHRRPGHRRARADRRSRPARPALRARAAAAACSRARRSPRNAHVARLPGDRRRAGRRRRCDAIVPDEDSCRRSTTRRRSPTARARRRSAR